MIRVTVIDSFPVSNRLAATSYPQGVVAGFAWTGDDDTLPVVGEEVRVALAGGLERAATVGEIKCHGGTRSLFFAGLTPADAPPGATIAWEGRRVGPRRVDPAGRIVVIDSVRDAVA